MGTNNLNDWMDTSNPSWWESVRNRNSPLAGELLSGALISHVQGEIVRIIPGKGGGGHLDVLRHPSYGVVAWNPRIRAISRHTGKEVLAGTELASLDEDGEWKLLGAAEMENKGLIREVQISVALMTLGIDDEIGGVLEHFGLQDTDVYQVTEVGGGKVRLMSPSPPSHNFTVGGMRIRPGG